MTKYIRYQYGITQVTFVHFRNFGKQNLISAKFYIYNLPFIGNQNAKFQLNFLTQTIVTVPFVRSPQNLKCPVSTTGLILTVSITC